MARKLGQSNGVGLVATYQLVLLYVDNQYGCCYVAT